MFTLLSSVLGFGSSFLPKVLGFFEEKRDQAHELQMMDKQLEQQIQLGKQKMQMTNIDADIRETEALHKEHAAITSKASQWCVNLSASVRPVITYCLFFSYTSLTLMLAFGLIDGALFSLLWAADGMSPIFAACLSFWFGQRTFNRK
tara:strand:+ start:2659 stop:3099 length:441 start_codon:yes stop_codon:yes gene_type:complete